MIREHYSKLLALGSTEFEKLIADKSSIAEFAKAHNFAENLEALAALIAGRPEAPVYQLALRELNFALLAAAACQYRHACSSLRLSLELGLNTVMFSGHELDLRLWLAGNLDLNWARLVDDQNGVFSKRFLRAFNDALEDEGAQYLNLAKRLYRELSEQIHGNPMSFSFDNAKISYDSEKLRKVLDAADTVRVIIEFSLLTRYLPNASIEARTAVEQIALEDFGHLPAVRRSYN